ncbi:MAG: hypothetical protein KKD11_05435 [Candidatus Omnitrophica bacterium]|nr:hypothetical protein [Candidatus Omnitrophota bacterium]
MNYADILLESKNKGRRLLGDNIKNNDKFRKEFTKLMKQYLELIQSQYWRFDEIIAYFQMRLEMEQGVGDVLESNRAVKVGI